MRYVSVFSGVEAATLAWHQLGWEPVAFSEIDPFPSAVLAERFPDVPNLGDITKVDWSEIGSVDLVVGGSPCQSFSVAGKREGLAGASGLMFEYIRCVRELRPRWFVWENVPGALSSEGGAAFGQLLTEMDDLGYGLAWRVLDAQFFGVAQRRRRVFLVGSLGDGGARRACEVLFEREGLLWDTPPSREKRKALAARAEGGARSAGGCLTPWDNQAKRVFSPDSCGPTLSSGNGEGMNIQPSVLCAGFKYHQGSGAGGIGYTPEQSPTLTADWHNPAVCIQGTIARGEQMGQTGEGYRADGACYTLNTIDRHAVCIQGSMVGRSDAARPQGRGINDDVSFTLNTSDRHAVLCTTDTQSNAMVAEDLCGTLSCHSKKDPPVVCRTDERVGWTSEIDDAAAFAQNTRDEVRYVNGDGTITGALAANPGMKQTSYVKTKSVVRRLTPRECERLQGMPDDWTRIPYKGKPAEDCPDGPRYKAIGNSMAVPVMRWIGERIAMVDKLEGISK